MKMFDDKEMEDMKKKHDVADMLMELLAKTGDKRAILMNKFNDFMNTWAKVIHTAVDNEELIDKTQNLIAQFENILNDFAKDNNIEIEEKE